MSFYHYVMKYFYLMEIYLIVLFEFSLFLILMDMLLFLTIAEKKTGEIRSFY